MVVFLVVWGILLQGAIFAQVIDSFAELRAARASTQVPTEPQNQKSETKIPKKRNQKPETRNPKPQAPHPTTGNRKQKTETRKQKPEPET